MKNLTLLLLFTGLFLAHPLFAAPTFTDINTALGFPLLADDSLWDDDNAVVATRLGWPAESQTPEDSSNRLFTNPDVKSLGAHPYCMTLYGLAGKPSRISMVFANQGDFGGYFKIAESLLTARGTAKTALDRQAREVMRDFPKALEADAKTIDTTLTTLLGKPSPCRFSLGGSTAEKVSRWDWQGHAFLLAKLEQGYVALQILPIAAVNVNEAAVRQRDAALKEKLRSQLVKRPNGDVVVGGLPMVDQGPKGFCVPATMERYSRYLGIPSDMYLLAVQAQTGMGGGTTGNNILSVANSIALANGRRVEKFSANLRLNQIERYIDEGLPIMWSLNARDDIEHDISDRSVQRKNTPDAATWKTVLKNVKKPKPLHGEEPQGHVCLITGYNKETGEVALSDSWGPDFAERWMTMDELDAMKQDFAAVISF